MCLACAINPKFNNCHYYLLLLLLLLGEYKGFDPDQLTCQDGGKSLVMRDIKKNHE